MRRLAWICAAVGLAACGDNRERPVPDATPDALSLTCDDNTVEQGLAAVPGITAVDEQPCGDYVRPGARCFVLTFDQPVRHADPAGQHFGQKLWLVHRTCAAPMLVADWGYSQDLFFDDELSILYGTNALWIEHRYQGQSTPATWDWGALTIENGADDMHEIITSLRALYHGRWVSTGASKGGITATYHRYFFPDDVDGSVPYVAPASRARVDPAYQTRLAEALPQPCAQKVRDYQVAALTTRRDLMLSRLTPLSGAGYESLYLEVYVSRLDWGFWQHQGLGSCALVPAADAPDDAFWQFFATLFSSPRPAAGFAPANAEYSNGSLSYEWLSEQGFALQIGAHVQPLLTEPFALSSMEDSFRSEFPDVELPAFNGSVTTATRLWARGAKDMLFIYGDLDPWSGGALDAPTDPSSAKFYVPGANHGAQITALPGAPRIDALALTTRMFGHPPSMSRIEDARKAASVRTHLLELRELDAVTGVTRYRR